MEAGILPVLPLEEEDMKELNSKRWTVFKVVTHIVLIIAIVYLSEYGSNLLFHGSMWGQLGILLVLSVIGECLQVFLEGVVEKSTFLRKFFESK